MNKNSSVSSMFSRRSFMLRTGYTVLGTFLLHPFIRALGLPDFTNIRQNGPASKYTPSLKVAFVRREEEYGMWWPGQVYDGKAALANYKEQILETGRELSMKIDLQSKPIYSIEEAEQWIKKAKIDKPDGLLIVLLDRQQHAWPTANMAIDSKIPTVVFSPLGSSFTTNTSNPSYKDGVFICSTDDFSQPAFGMKMIKAGARLRETRYLVIKGSERKDAEIQKLGMKLRYLPAQEFIDEYNRIPVNNEVKELASQIIKNATGIDGPSTQDIYNGIKSYIVARNLLERERCDAITMDCLGALASINISLPCIAWSKMNDQGIPAACEADIGACVTHAIVQYLFDRPGFQQDPVAETAKECLIGSHCTCATKLNGFSNGQEPYSIVHHHGNRDATAKPVWKIGQRITVADTLIPREYFDPASETVNPIKMLISAGVVVDNKSIPPSGGCVVAPMVKLDNVDSYLDYPGFHQIFFYGDYKRELKYFCQLYGIQPEVI